jgi:hypothetical protein
LAQGLAQFAHKDYLMSKLIDVVKLYDYLSLSIYVIKNSFLLIYK